MIRSAGPRGGGGAWAPTEEAVSALKNVYRALYDIVSIYGNYLDDNSAERKGGRGGTDRAVNVTLAFK